MAKTNKCAHPSCTCQVPEKGDFGKYCSEHCRDAADVVEIRCECGHSQCR